MGEGERGRVERRGKREREGGRVSDLRGCAGGKESERGSQAKLRKNKE